MKKFLKKLGIILGGLIGLIIVIHTILNITFSIQLHNKIAELKRQGKPTTIAEVIPPPVPDEENAAILYNKAFIYGGDRIGKGKLNEIVRAVIEEKIMSKRSGNIFSDISIWTYEQREKIPKLVNSKEAQYIYELLEEASKKPKCRFDIEYEKGGKMILPHLNSMRSAVRFLCLKALLEAEEDNMEKAFDILLIGLKVSNHLKDEPILISQLVRIACDNIIIECVESIADSKSITHGQATLMMNELSNHKDVKPFLKCMDGERILLGDWGFGRLIRGEVSRKELAGLITLQATLGDPKDWKYPLNVRLLCYLLTSPLYRPIIKKDYICHLTLLSKMQDNYNLPYYEVAQEIQNNSIERRVPRYCVFTRMSLPSLIRQQENLAKHQTNIEICRTGLALKIYKIANKTYPEKLEDLVPDFLDEVPIDPFSGKKIIYNKYKNWFQLYSFGPNMQDDGGISRAKIIASQPLRDSTEDYDIVWECRE